MDLWYDDIDEETEPPLCPNGDGYGAPLGTLGRLKWFRCAACGIDFYQMEGASIDCGGD